MTVRTGTSNTGKVHRYYACSSRARQGPTACKGRSIPMDTLDALVTSHLADRLLNRERLTTMLATLANRRAAKAAAVDGRLAILEREACDADERLRRLYKLVETGLVDMDDILKERISALKADRDRAHAAIDRVRSVARPRIEISSNMVERFGQTMRQSLTTGEIPFRKAYLGSIVDRIVVEDRKISIFGRKGVLGQAVLAGNSPLPGVRSFVRKWRTGQDETANTYVLEIVI